MEKVNRKKEEDYKSRLDQISEESCGCWYLDMRPWQRKDLTKEELYQYAEEMRERLEKIFDLSYII